MNFLELYKEAMTFGDVSIEGYREYDPPRTEVLIKREALAECGCCYEEDYVFAENENPIVALKLAIEKADIKWDITT